MGIFRILRNTGTSQGGEAEERAGSPWLLGFLGAITLCALCACSPEPSSTDSAGEETAAEEQPAEPFKLSVENIIVEPAGAEQLTIQGPREFLTPELLAVLQRELREVTGVETEILADSYDSGVDLMADLQSHSGGDLVLVPQESVGELQQMGLLRDFTSPTGQPVTFLPYQFAALGVVTASGSPEASWEALFHDQAASQDVTWMCRLQDVVSAAFLALNHSPNELDGPVIAGVMELLRATPVLDPRPVLEGVTPGEIITEQPALTVVTYSHMAPGLMDPDSALTFQVPVEGTVTFQVGWVIPRGSQERPTAEALLQVLARPAVAADFSRQLRMTPAENLAARDLLNQTDPQISPVTLPTERTYYRVSQITGNRADLLKQLQQIVLERDPEFTGHGIHDPLQPPPATALDDDPPVPSVETAPPAEPEITLPEEAGEDQIPDAGTDAESGEEIEVVE